MTAGLRNAPSIVDYLSNLIATASCWIRRLEGIGNVSIRQAKLDQSVASPSHVPASLSQTPASPSQAQPLGIKRFTQSSKKEDSGPSVAPSFAPADARPSQITTLSSQLLSPLPPNFSSTITRKRKASLVTRACSTPNMRSQFVEVDFDGATLKTLQDLVQDLSKFASGIYQHLRNAKIASIMKAMALEVDKDDDCANSDEEGAKAEHTVLEPSCANSDEEGVKAEHTVLEPSYDQTASMASQPSIPSTFKDLKKGLADCENQCYKAADSLLKCGDCSSEIGDIRSKLEELKEMAQKEIEMLSVK